MNSLDTIRFLHQVADDGLSQILQNFSEAYLANLSDKILSLAEKLKAKKEERIKDLIENGPRVFYELGKLVIVLLREGEEKYHCFGKQCVELDSDGEIVRRRFRLAGKADENGQMYFVKVFSSEYGQGEDGGWVSNNEWIGLQERLIAAEKKEFGDR